MIGETPTPEFFLIVSRINIYYCMTGRAIQGNIQFEGGSIGPTASEHGRFKHAVRNP